MSTPLAEPGTLRWCRASDTHEVALDGDTLVCRNSRGRLLKSVPKAVRETEIAQGLVAVREHLRRHEKESRDTVESWMLGALPIPVRTIAAVWRDPAWRRVLNDLAVTTGLDREPGLLRMVDEDGRLGVITLDAETEWLSGTSVYIPHPVLLDDLSDLRDLAVELGVAQSIPQLTREIFVKPDAPVGSTVTAFANGEFDEMRQLRMRAINFGFGVRGPFAVCSASDGGVELQARYWLGDTDPYYSTTTGDLMWVDREERTVRLSDVGPIAWSEGTRMAEIIYSGRKTDER